MSSEPYIGSIVMFAGNFAPRGWAFCAGQLLSIQQNTALFSILGTTYGGDGRVTFGLPDLRARGPVGTGQGPGLTDIQLGQLAGTENVTLLTSNLPAHNHPINCDNNASSAAQPSGLIPGFAGDRTASLTIYSGAAPNAQMSPQTVGMTGNSVPVGIRDPYLGINFIIATEGIFPSRN
jgi:microcystin-dependent protein